MDPIDYLEDDEALDDQDDLAMDAASRRHQPWSPPDDPPIVPGGDDNAEIPGSLDDDLDDEQEDSAPARQVPDDEITARVRRLLRSDSATSMLRVLVSTEDGVVTLRGMVQTLEDTDNAAEVASRVEGVLDVVDEIDVEV